MKVNLLMEYVMDQGNVYLLMDVNIQENGGITKYMDREV